MYGSLRRGLNFKVTMGVILTLTPHSLLRGRRSMRRSPTLMPSWLRWGTDKAFATAPYGNGSGSIYAPYQKAELTYPIGMNKITQ